MYISGDFLLMDTAGDKLEVKTLHIYGGLEIGSPQSSSSSSSRKKRSTTSSNKMEIIADRIIIYGTGGLFIGWPDEPINDNVVITVRGLMANLDDDDEDLGEVLGTVNIGTKAIGKFAYSVL